MKRFQLLGEGEEGNRCWAMTIKSVSTKVCKGEGDTYGDTILINNPEGTKALEVFVIVAGERERVEGLSKLTDV